jgi:hypothetical protein
MNGGKKMNYKNQIGCCFIIDNEEFIYEGLFEKSAGAYICNNCRRELKGRYHLFNSLKGYQEGKYESRVYGTECIKKIIQAGYKKSI